MSNNLNLDELLKEIEQSGSVSVSSSSLKYFINKNEDNILDRGNGRLRIRPNFVKKFSLILSKPSGLELVEALSIRCLCCKKILSYPAYHLRLNFDKNIFDYFVCFSGNSVLKYGDCLRGK